MAETIADYRRKQLLGVTRYWITQIEEIRLRQISDDVYKTLESGRAALKLERPDSQNALRYGLLSGGMFGESKIPVDDIALAFRLWSDGWEPFNSLTGRHGLFEVFSVVGWLASDDTQLDSFIHLNAFLADSLTFLAEQYRDDAKKFYPAWRSLKNGPKASAIKRSKGKAEKLAKIHAAADEYRRRNPRAKNAEIADHLAGLGLGTVQTITKYLAGNKESFMNEMATQFRSRER